MGINRVKQFFPILGVLIILALPGGQSAAINWPAIGAWALNWLRSFALFLILGGLAIWLIPKPLIRWSEVARRSPVKSFGVGIVILIAGYAALVILFVLLLASGIFFYSVRFSNLASLILNLGVPGAALVFGSFNLVVSYISKLVVVFLFGRLLLESIYPKALKHNFWPLLVGLVIYLLLRAIPWLGWAIGSVATLVGLGAIWLGLFSRSAAVEAAVEPPPPAEPAIQTTASEQQEGETNLPTPEPESVGVQDQPVVNPPDWAPELGNSGEDDMVKQDIGAEASSQDEVA